MCTTVGGTTPMTFVDGILGIDIGNATPGAAPTYQLIIAVAAQTVFNTIISTVPISSNISYLVVFVNGLMQVEGLLYTVTGSNQITFANPLSVLDEVAIYSYASGVQFGGGSEYFQDVPSLEFVPAIGVTPSAVATGVVTTNGGNIISINVTNAGLGYTPVAATMTASSSTGTGSLLIPLVNASGQIAGISIPNGGTGYTLADTVTATRAVSPNSAYTTAIFTITSVSMIGEILAIAIINPGTGYQPSVTEVRITSSLTPLLNYPLGTGFMGTVITNTNGSISGVIVSNTGAGYAVYPPYLVISDPGIGATTRVVLSGNSVSSITLLTPGTGYTQGAIGTVFNPPTAELPNPPINPAHVAIRVAENTRGTTPSAYWQTWAGTVTNKPIQLQINQVVSYFKRLGYSVIIQTNPATNNTIQWKICW
jgi:hypothetical protein